MILRCKFEQLSVSSVVVQLSSNSLTLCNHYCFPERIMTYCNAQGIQDESTKYHVS